MYLNNNNYYKHADEYFGSLCTIAEIVKQLKHVDAVVEFHAGKIQSYSLLQCWSHIRYDDGSIQTCDVQENTR